MSTTNITNNYYEPLSIITTTNIMTRTRRRRQARIPFAPAAQEPAQEDTQPVVPPMVALAEEAQDEDPFAEAAAIATISEPPPTIPSSSSTSNPTPSSSSARKPPKRNSWIWNHMPDEDPETRYYDSQGNEIWRCGYCDKSYRVSGSTTPCIDHLTDPEGAPCSIPPFSPRN